MKDQVNQSYLPTFEAISPQIERMLASPEFNATPQQVALLKFVVEQTVSGKACDIKGYTLAVQVFGRDPDFDQRSDSIVSIQASRLRGALTHYYETDGRDDSIRIDIPKGTYVPVFKRRCQSQPPVASRKELNPDVGDRSSRPIILIRPLRNLSGDPRLDRWSIGFSTELADELSRYPFVLFMTHDPESLNKHADRDAVRFIVDGNVRSDGASIKIILNLTDTRTGRQIWSESSRSSIEAAGRIAYQEELAGSMAVKIAGDRGVIMKVLIEESKPKSPNFASEFEAMLRYFELKVTFAPDALSRALTALEKAVVINPEYGPAWSMLARLYADIHVFEIPGFNNGSLEKAFEFAQNGARLSPEDQRCRAIKAYIHLFRNDLATGLAEAERALQLGPGTLNLLDGIGYLMTLLGDWERGTALIERALELNPFYGNYVHYALWINSLRQNDYINAHRETLKLNRPALFWDHLVRAASYGLLGNLKEGRKSAAELLNLKPDFTERGRILIGHYIKFDDILEQVIKGLDAVGVEVD